MKQFGIEVTVSMWTTFKAENEHDALEQCHEWVSLEYGNLADKAAYTVTELK